MERPLLHLIELSHVTFEFFLSLVVSSNWFIPPKAEKDANKCYFIYYQHRNIVRVTHVVSEVKSLRQISWFDCFKCKCNLIRGACPQTL